MLVASWELNKRGEVTDKQNEIAAAFTKTMGAGSVEISVKKPAAERAQDRHGLIDLQNVKY